MKKTLLCLITVLYVLPSFGQVGINTVSPLTTFHLEPNKTDGTTAEGIIAPRLTRAQLIAKDAQYTTAHAGTYMYVTTLDGTVTTKTTNVITTGYYYYDGTIWKHFNDKLQISNKGLSVTSAAEVQLGGELSKATKIDTKGNKLSIVGTTDTGLQLPTGAGTGKLLTSDATGNVSWEQPIFSNFAFIDGYSINTAYTVNYFGYSIVNTGFSLKLAPGTYLISLGILIQEDGGLAVSANKSYFAKLMPTNNFNDWASTANRFEGSYEAAAIHLPNDDPRIYLNQAIRFTPTMNTAYLFIAITGSGKFTVSLGVTNTASRPQSIGGSYVRISD